MKKIITLFSALLCVSLAFSQADDLMIVEYVDWSSGNGFAVKVFNPTNSSVNLGNYTLNVYNNGNTSPSGSYTLSGTLLPDSTIIIGNTSYCSSNCSTSGGNYGCGISTSSSGVNENDVIALLKSGNYVDMVGLVGYNPGSSGWTVGGVSNAHLWHKMTRNANNCTRYTSTSGTGTNSWPNSSSTNHTGWTVTGVSCLVKGYSLNTSSGKPKIQIPSNDTVVCQGTPVNFTADGSYKWYRKNGSGSTVLNNSATTLSVSFSVNGSDTIIAEGTSCGALVYDTLVVKVGAPFSFSFGPDSTFCGTLNYTLNPAITGATYVWQDNTTTATYGVTAAGTYWAHATRDNCLAADTIVISFQPAAVPSLGADTSICAGDSIIKTNTCTGCSYLWSTNETTPSITIKQTGNYWLQVDDGGCKTYDTINVTVNPIPMVSLGADTTGCVGDSVIKAYTCTGCTYLWSTNETTPSKNIKQTGTYWLQVTDAGCKNADTVNVTFNTLPVVNLGADVAICQNDSIVKTFTCAGCSYLWSTNETTPAITIKQSGNYWLEVTDAGCKNYDTIIVTQNPLPVFTLGADISLCSGTSAILRIPLTGVQQVWSDNSVADSLVVSTAGTFWARATQNGCSYTDSIDIAVVPAPAKVLRDSAICTGQTITLDATVTGATYLWDDNSTQNTCAVNAPGTYKVAVTINGCTFADSATITQGALPSKPNIRDTVVCEDASITLNGAAQGATQYVWNTGETSAAITLDSGGTYIVTAINSCGSVSDTATITVNVCDPPFIPNVFTPNNDGLNDGFFIDFKNARSFKIEIFNRWGEKIFESNSASFVWKGDYKGQLVPSGVYFYVITAQTGLGKSYNTSGTLTLIR